MKATFLYINVTVAAIVTHVDHLVLWGEASDPVCVCVWQVDRVESLPTCFFSSLELQARTTAASVENTHTHTHTHLLGLEHALQTEP